MRLCTGIVGAAVEVAVSVDVGVTVPGVCEALGVVVDTAVSVTVAVGVGDVGIQAPKSIVTT